ncbi:MAG TPA: alpha/beta fold hydrolase [Candidatus Mcinerneyibacterium sp.]|nr:alpha/beta fold hydrolase [Candidatus Mcinerneyibacterium sp.]
MKRFPLTIIIFLFILAGCAEKSEKKIKKDPNNIYRIKKIRETDIPSTGIKIEKKLDYIKGEYQEYLISYKSDGLKIYAKMNIPDKEKPKSGFPVVLINHGYIPPNRYSTDDSYKLVEGFFAKNGFITFKSDYRGFGNSDRHESWVYNRLGQIRDVKILLNSINSFSEVDKNNIFVYGHSMGGEVTIKLLQTDKKSMIKAASLWAPCYERYPEVSLFFIRKGGGREAENVKERILQKIPEENFKFYSVTNYVNFINTPIVLHHGTNDKSVPLKWSLNLVNKLQEYNKNYKFYRYTDDHNLSNNFFSVLRKDVIFFKSFIN